MIHQTAHACRFPSPRPTCDSPNRERMLPAKSPAHKRPVLDRAVCGFAAVDIAAVLWLTPKHFAAIQLPRTNQPFPKPRAASGWLPAAAFHPANPQAEASAKFLVPFFKKGTSFRDGKTRRAPRALRRPPRLSLRLSPPRPLAIQLPPWLTLSCAPRSTNGQRSPRLWPTKPPAPPAIHQAANQCFPPFPRA